MTQQTIGLGSTANDGNGDDPRTAGTKINENFTELYNRTGRMYVDSINGDDSNSGLTSSTPKKTLAAAVAAVPNNSTLWLKCGSRWHEPLTLTNSHAYVDIKGYGTGAWPIIDGSRPIPSGSWNTDPGGRTGVYYADVTYSEAMALGSGIFDRFELYDEGDGYVKDDSYVPITLTGTLAERLDFLEANPDTCTVQIQGDDVTAPLNSGETDFRFWIKTRDGSNPASNGRTIYYAEHPQALTISLGTNLERLTVQRCCTKDMCGATGGAGLSGQVAKHCEFLSASCHATVFRGMEFEDCLATGNATRYGTSGNGFHFFRSHGTEGIGNPRAIRCEARGLYAGISSHGSGGGPEHETVYIKDFKAVNCISGVTAGTIKEKAYLENILIEDCYDGVDVRTAGFCEIKNFKFVSATRENAGTEQRRSAFTFGSGGRFVIDDAIVIFQDAPGNPRCELVASASAGDDITFNRLINIGGLEADLSSNKQGTVTFNDSVVNLSSGASANVNANNSYLRDNVATIAEMNTANSGINLNCIGPYVHQPFTRVVQEGDVSYLTLPGTASGTAGNDWIALNWAVSYGAELGTVVIEGAGAGGADLVVRGLVSNAGNSNAGFTRAYDLVSPATLPETFSGATAKVPYYNRNIFPVNAGTATLNNNFSYVRLSNPEHFTVGQYIVLGGLANRTAYGLRKIVSLVGDLAELDQECRWRFWDGDMSGGLRYKELDGTSFTTPPSVSVSLGIPLLTASTNTEGLEGTLTYVEGGTLDFTDREEQNRLRPSGAGTLDTEGNRITNIANNGNYEPVEPLIRIGFAVLPGDTIDLVWRAYIQQFAPEFVSNPEYSWDATLKGDSVLAQRGIGVRKHTL